MHVQNSKSGEFDDEKLKVATANVNTLGAKCISVKDKQGFGLLVTRRLGPRGVTGGRAVAEFGHAEGCVLDLGVSSNEYGYSWGAALDPLAVVLGCGAARSVKNLGGICDAQGRSWKTQRSSLARSKVIERGRDHRVS